MEQDEWTPARGWMIVLGKAGMRAGILLVGLTAFLYLAMPVINAILSFSELPKPFGIFTGFWMIGVLILMSVAGFVLGYVVVRNIKEDSALGGWLLLLPMLVIITVAEVGACCLAAALRSGSPTMLIITVCTMFFWGWVACFVKLILM